MKRIGSGYISPGEQRLLRAVARKRRGKGAMIILLIAASFLFGAALTDVWPGSSSRERLAFERALEIARDKTATEEQRRTALGRLTILSREAGIVLNETCDELPGIRPDANNWRPDVLEAWKEKQR